MQSSCQCPKTIWICQHHPSNKRFCSNWWLCLFVFNAIAPSHVSVKVKFRDQASGLNCDLNVNDRLGIVNSNMVKQYCDAHPLLRPLLYRVKEWAKPLGLNSPSPPRGSVSFSSYALTLMTIGFLQVCQWYHFLQSSAECLPTERGPSA